ncbi:unnamed protein product, partial [Oikopleura dioica]
AANGLRRPNLGDQKDDRE